MPGPIRSKLYFIIFIICLMSIISCSTKERITPSASIITWEKTFGSIEQDNGRSVVITSDGGYMIAGGTRSFGNNSDVYVIRMNPLGDTLWARTYSYDASSDDWGYTIVSAGGGEFVIAGECWTAGSGMDMFLFKIDSAGTKVWQHRIGQDNVNEYGKDVAPTADGGYIVAGYSMRVGSSIRQFYLAKANSSGDTAWTRVFDSCWSDNIGVAQAHDGGYVITGDYAGDAGLIKTNSLGFEQWISRSNRPDWDAGYSVKQTGDSGFVIVGSAVTGANSQTYLFKTDRSGNTLWQKFFSGLGVQAIGHYVSLTSDGGYIIAGETGASVFESTAHLIKTNSSGNMVWEKTFGGAARDYGYSVIQTGDGGYLIAGETASSGAGGYDVYLIKTDANGNVFR